MSEGPFAYLTFTTVKLIVLQPAHTRPQSAPAGALVAVTLPSFTLSLAPLPTVLKSHSETACTWHVVQYSLRNH